MKTSNFFSIKLTKDMDLVSIAGLSPKEIREKFPKMRRYDLLIPPKQLVLDYKSGKINKHEYTKIYQKQLNNLDPCKVYEDLKDSIILCWEPPWRFCHRNLIAKWLNNSLGLNIKEL